MKHVCAECGSNNIRILTRALKNGKRVWYVACAECNAEGGDYSNIPAAVASCRARPAEARVGGVLRGGYVVEDRFHYHGRALTVVRVRETKDLRFQDENMPIKPRRVCAWCGAVLDGGAAPGQGEQRTHGICDECERRFEADAG
jgi:hypothetical protein